MSRTLIIELKENDFEIDGDISPEDADLETNPEPIHVPLIEQVTLGRGEDPTKTQAFTNEDASEDQKFEAEMMMLKNPHVNLSSFHAHHRGVSRTHARITLHGSRMSVTDLGSTNGTYVNNEKLAPNTAYPLKSGDELRLGFLALSIHLS